jgi:hypothetical protein
MGTWSTTVPFRWVTGPIALGPPMLDPAACDVLHRLGLRLAWTYTAPVLSFYFLPACLSWDITILLPWTGA